MTTVLKKKKKKRKKRKEQLATLNTPKSHDAVLNIAPCLPGRKTFHCVGVVDQKKKKRGLAKVIYPCGKNLDVNTVCPNRLARNKERERRDTGTFVIYYRTKPGGFACPLLTKAVRYPVKKLNGS